MTRLLRRNLGLKIFSLLLAYGTWAYVAGLSPSVRFVNAPLELSGPEALVVVDYQPRELRVRLEGDAPQLNRAVNVYARVRLDAAARSGQQRITVQDRDVVGVPNGVTRELQTPVVTVTLERRTDRKVAVRVRFAGEPAPGYRIVRATTEPASVEASGPESAVRTLDAVYTEALDPSTYRMPFTRPAILVRPDALVTLQPDEVTTTVIIEEVPTTTEYDLPIESNDPLLEPEPARVKVRLEGPPSLLERLRPRITAVADVAASGRGGSAPVRLVMGDLTADEAARIRIQQLDPPRVRLRRAQD